jgi:phosphonate transport system ATP-binding protein
MFQTQQVEEPVAILHVENLCKQFLERGTVLDNVNLQIPHGQAVALIGSNGCGKTTLLRCCIRLVEPDSGTVRLLGTDLCRVGKRKLRRIRTNVGFVFQRHNLVPRLSVLTNVIHGAFSYSQSPRVWYQGLAHKESREEAMYRLHEVGLAHLAKQRADKLSGGESQRVAIARALMQRPKFIMADEPVASLDPKVGDEVLRLFIKLIRLEKLTLFYVSHNLEQALSYSDRVIGIRNTKLALDSPSGALGKNDLRGIYD